MDAAIEQELRTSIEELGRLLNVLGNDLRRCEILLNEADDIDAKQFYARVAVRSLFALIEGCTFRLKQMTIPMAKGLSVKLLPGEVLYLTERQPGLDDNLQITERRVNIPLQKNVRFTFHTLAKTCGAPLSLNTSGSGWHAFRKSIKIRDRLMHPKCEGDTVIMENEMMAVSLTSKWFIESVTEFFSYLGYPIAMSDTVHGRDA
jgi:hypothetical protein